MELLGNGHKKFTYLLKILVIGSDKITRDVMYNYTKIKRGMVPPRDESLYHLNGVDVLVNNFPYLKENSVNLTFWLLNYENKNFKSILGNGLNCHRKGSSGAVYVCDLKQDEPLKILIQDLEHILKTKNPEKAPENIIINTETSNITAENEQPKLLNKNKKQEIEHLEIPRLVYLTVNPNEKEEMEITEHKLKRVNEVLDKYIEKGFNLKLCINEKPGSISSLHTGFTEYLIKSIITNEKLNPVIDITSSITKVE